MDSNQRIRMGACRLPGHLNFCVLCSSWASCSVFGRNEHKELRRTQRVITFPEIFNILIALFSLNSSDFLQLLQRFNSDEEYNDESWKDYKFTDIFIWNKISNCKKIDN